jgi:hypothetical protein
VLLVNAGLIVSIDSLGLKFLINLDVEATAEPHHYSLPIMSDEESYVADGKGVIDEPLKKNGEKALSAKDLEPFGNEETAEVKYRTMKWW